ncbi:MAG: hypothetical protein AB7N71_12760 [Phycisphaerae bacterium]
MKISWLWFVVATIICWGSYVPAIHAGQMAIGGKFKGIWAFLFVGFAYFLTGVLLPIAYLWMNRADLGAWPTSRGAGISLFAGILGAIGAFGVILALMSGGTPKTVPPLVFAGAPIMATIVAMAMHPPTSKVNPLFFVGILLAAAGAGLVLRFKPS